MTRFNRAQLGALVLCLAWLVPGLVGHVPWKGTDGDTFATLLWAQKSGDWLVPAVAGSIDLSHGPFYTWVAGILVWVCSFLLAPHNAARLTSGLAVGLAVWFMSLAARRLHGEETGWPAALMLLGSLGLLLPGHTMDPHVIQLAGVSALLFGLADMLTSPRRGGTAAGLGLAAMGLSIGWLEPVTLTALLPLLMMVLPEYRSSQVRRGWLLLLLCSLLPLGLWLLVLHQREGHLLAAWWNENSRRLVFVSSQHAVYRPGYIVRNLLWFAWPAWPVALWAVYRFRKGWRTPAILMPVAVLALPLAALSLTVDPDEVAMMPLLPPIALLGGAGLLSLRRGAAYALLWFGVMVFSFFALAFWVYFVAWQFGSPAPLARRLAKLGVTPYPEIRYWAMALGALLTLTWFAWTPRIKRSAVRPILIWVAGMSFVWLLLMVLLLPAFDRRLGYEVMAGQISDRLGATRCVATRGMPPTQRALLSYHTGLDFSPLVSDCDWLMLYSKRSREVPPGSRWIKRWDGARPGDRNEHFWLYQKFGAKKQA